VTEVEIPEDVTVGDLANLIAIPATRLVSTAFRELGRVLTIHDTLPFDDARELIAHFGFNARKRRG